MDHHLIEKIQKHNRASKNLVLFTIQKKYFFKTEHGTFDYYIDCTFTNLKDSIIYQLSFASERALENAIDFINANPSYQFEDLQKFSIKKITV